jgi:uncharacterized YigZ family protein
LKERYRTVFKETTAEIVEKRSRFIATVKPVSCEEEAIEFIEKLKKQYWDARHNVYAYRIEENNIQRYSDDGEPAGTAGLPVLEIIKREELSNIVVVVTRYFGGILLGTGGLVHAYSKSAKLGIEEANPIDMVLCQEVKISCDYSLLGKVQSEVLNLGFKNLGTQYSDIVTVDALVPQHCVKKFTDNMIDKTNGKITMELGEVGYNQI